MFEVTIIIESFNFSRIEPDKATLVEIQKVVDAQNALKRAQFEKDRAEIDAQKRRIVAQGEAEAKKAAIEKKAAEEAKKGEAEDVLKKLLANGMTAEEILAKLQ